MTVEFFVPMKPPTVTAQEKKVAVVHGKPRFYEPEKLKAARAKLQACIAPHRPPEPLQGAVRLVVKWLFPVTARHHNGEYKATKPDTDNLEKLLKDVLTGLGFWQDDAQVASEIIEKFYADIPGLYIQAEELP